jgi:Protein of unknown function (DUF3313)
MKTHMRRGISGVSLAVLAAGLFFAALVSGCAATVQSTPAAIESSPGAGTTGFLGSDYSLLKPGKEGQALLVYINPNIQRTKYDKVMIDPVQFWDGKNSDVPAADQQTLTTYFYNALNEELAKNFTVVDQPGPGTIRLQVALINATASTPGMRSISVIVPQARILNAAQSMATGSYAFVGSAEAAMKVTDSQTGELLGAAMDQRKGGMALSTAAQWKWGDAENVMKFWAEKISTRLSELRTRGATTAG